MTTTNSLFRILLIALIIAAPLTLNSCLSSKMTEALAQHQMTISKAAASNQPASEKLDIAAETFVSVLDEALRFGQAKKVARHVDLFSKQNEKDLDKILGEVETWMGNLSTGEQLLMVGKIATKPYTRQLITLIPKFEKKVERRVKTFLFLSRLTKIVSPGKLLDNL